MCGFAGIVRDKPVDQNVLAKMEKAIAHRGPDDSGTLILPGAALVHRRLSIIDLEGSRQPMSSADGRFHIVFNGEIYNFKVLRAKLLTEGHKLETSGDTEVILELYRTIGKSCVNQLQGMFSFAIWDSLKQSLFCARDRYGQKPFFYCFSSGQFIFGSEIKAILAASDTAPELDLTTLYHYMGLRYAPGKSSLFKNIYKIPPASALTLENGNIRIDKYWDIDYKNKFERSEPELVDQLHEILKQTIELHMVSDVRVGTFLSGGVDSSIVTSIASKMINGQLPTFSVGSESSDFSELPYALEVSQKYNTEHHVKKVSPNLFETIPDIVWHLEEPGDPHGVGIYTLSHFTNKYVKVVLGGDGGDEMFAGYTRYLGQQLLQYYSFLPSWFRKHVVGSCIKNIPESFSYFSLATKGRWMNDASYFDVAERYYHSLVFFRFFDSLKNELFSDHTLAKIDDKDTAGKVTSFFNAPNADNLIDKIMYTDSMNRMPEHYLLIADRLSMAHGLEVRVPLIDHKLAEFVARIPHKLKIKWNNQKYIFKQVGRQYLSREFLNRTKRGFGYPMARWFKGSLKNFVLNIFNQSIMLKSGIFNKDFVMRIFTEHLNGAVDHNFRIWMLINLEVWYRIFILGTDKQQVKHWITSLYRDSQII